MSRPKRPHVREVRLLALHALQRGAKAPSPLRTTWNVAGRCSNPRFVQVHGQEWTGRRKLAARSYAEFAEILRNAHWSTGTQTVEMEVPCRRCGHCLRVRAARWRYRATEETAAAIRTWFGTLTLSPDAHSRLTMRARLRLSKGGTQFEALTEAEQFAERHREISREITLWLKRVRKDSGARLRYFLVAEAHKSGLPHYHCLVHETSARQCGERILRTQWKHGFSKFKLVQPGDKPAAYVCKYLSKSILARVRASIDYGKTPLGKVIELNHVQKF